MKLYLSAPKIITHQADWLIGVSKYRIFTKRWAANGDDMIDLIIYVEMALVAIFLLGQTISKDKNSPSNIATNIGLSVLVTSIGLLTLGQI